MDENIKNQWVEALRSGEYNQAKGVLKYVPDGYGDKDEKIGFCCLGVLCEIAVEARIVVPYGETGYVPPNRIDGSVTPDFACLPWEVVTWAKLNSCNPEISREISDKHTGVLSAIISATSLGSLNDRGASFEQIANIIEDAL